MVGGGGKAQKPPLPTIMPAKGHTHDPAALKIWLPGQTRRPSHEGPVQWAPGGRGVLVVSVDVVPVTVPGVVKSPLPPKTGP